MPALVSGGFNWVDARDVADGAIRAAEIAPKGSKYLLSGHWLSMAQLYDIVTEFTGKRRAKAVVPVWLAMLGVPLLTLQSRLTKKRNLFTQATLRTLNSNQKIKHDKATKAFGYKPRPIRKTLYDVLEWFSENGYLWNR